MFMLSDEARKMLFELAPVDFQSFVDDLSSVDRQKLADELEGIAIQATFTHAYVQERHGYGCGDQGHEVSAKAANKARRKIRNNVIGYNETRDIPI